MTDQNKQKGGEHFGGCSTKSVTHKKTAKQTKTKNFLKKLRSLLFSLVFYFCVLDYGLKKHSGLILVVFRLVLLLFCDVETRMQLSHAQRVVVAFICWCLFFIYQFILSLSLTLSVDHLSEKKSSVIVRLLFEVVFSSLLYLFVTLKLKYDHLFCFL